MRSNPPLVIFGNPGGKGWTKIATNVQAICYQHAKDGQDYVHGFGNHDPSEDDLNEGWLDLRALKARTGVQAYWSPDKKQVLLQRADGKPIIGLF